MKSSSVEGTLLLGLEYSVCQHFGYHFLRIWMDWKDGHMKISLVYWCFMFSSISSILWIQILTSCQAPMPWAQNYKFWPSGHPGHGQLGFFSMQSEPWLGPDARRHFSLLTIRGAPTRGLLTAWFYLATFWSLVKHTTSRATTGSHTCYEQYRSFWI